MIIPPTPSPTSSQTSVPDSGTFLISTYLLSVTSQDSRHQMITEHGIYSTAADTGSDNEQPPQSQGPISLLIENGKVISWNQE